MFDWLDVSKSTHVGCYTGPWTERRLDTTCFGDQGIKFNVIEEVLMSFMGALKKCCNALNRGISDLLGLQGLP